VKTPARIRAQGFLAAIRRQKWRYVIKIAEKRSDTESHTTARLYRPGLS
jgi:hypothetical protein